MTMPADTVWPDGADVDKDGVKRYVEEHTAVYFAAADDLRAAAPLYNTLAYIGNLLYQYDPAEEGADSGGDAPAILVTDNDRRYVKLGRAAGVIGPGSSVDGNLPSFSGTDGDTLQDSGIAASGVALRDEFDAFGPIINGDMALDQRAAGPYTASNYTLDRWRLGNGSGATNSIDQAAGLTDDAEFSLSWDRTVAGSSTTFLYQPIEDVRTLEGETVTVSFDAKSETGGTVTVRTRLDQVFGSGGSATAATSQVTHSVGPAVQRYTATHEIPSVAGKTIGPDNYLALRFLRITTEEDGEVKIGNVRIDRGSSAAPFRRRPQALELMLAQRYYQRLDLGTFGYAANASTVHLQGCFPTLMRAQPTLSLVDTSISVSIESNSPANSSGSMITASQASDSGFRIFVNGFSGLTATNFLMLNQNTDWLEADAEL